MIKLTNFPIKKQNTPFSCGYSTLSATLSFLEKNIEEKNISKQSYFHLINNLVGFFSPAVEVRGISSAHFAALFNKLAVRHQVKLVQFIDQPTSLDTIRQQLSNNFPVPFVYASVFDFDKTKIVLHYSTIIGLDQDRNQIIIADPFGYEKILSLADFFAALNFSNYSRVSLVVKLIINLGMIKKNSLFIIRQK